MDVAFDGLRRIAAAADQTSKERIACCCPCVFDIDVWPALELQIARAGSTAGELAAALVFVREMYDSLRRDLRVYALENTPLTILCDEIEHKERSLANAMSVVRTTEFLNRISPLYLAAESAYCVTSARGPRWESAVVRMELTLVAVNAFSLRHHSDIGAIYGAKLNWLAVAQAALTESEDSDIYKAAFTVADELFAMATQSAREDWTGAISFALGSLIFDAYCNRSPANYSTRSIRSGKGRIPARRPLPDRQIELRTSLAHLRAAVELREGSYRGIAAKALSFLLSALSESGEKIDLDELLRSVSVALELLPGNGYQTARHCVAVLGNCYGARYSLDKYPLEPLPLETVTNAEVNATIEELVRRVRELAMATPRAALDLLLDAAPVLRRAGERARSVCWGLERRLFAQTTALPEDDWAQLIGDFGLDNFARIAVQHAWGVEERAEVALNLAIYGLKAGPETLSLEFIGVLRCEESKVLTRHDSFVCVLEAYLYRAVGADLWNEGSASTAAQSYFESLARFARDGLELSCTDILNRLIDIAALADICKDVLERLPYLIPSLEVLLGEDGVLQIQTIGRRGLSRGNFLDHRFVTTWMRAFKGLRFACALNHPARYVWRRDPEACRLIDRVTRLRAAVPEPSALHQNSLEESIVAVALPDMHLQEGGTATERLQNAQIRFDWHLRESARNPTVPELDDAFERSLSVQSKLDDRTVLVQMFVTPDFGGAVKLHLAFTTNDDLSLRQTTWHGTGGDDGVQGTGTGEPGSDMGRLVHKTRSGITMTPWLGKVTLRGSRLLTTSLDKVLGSSAVDLLRQYRLGGKEHICIVPHGPLHYFPYHLLSIDGSFLADHWVVTYLPDVALLRERSRCDSPPSKREHRTDAFVGFGLGFDGANRSSFLDPIPSARDSVKRISEMFNERAVLDNEATKVAFISRAPFARFVHLSSHAEHSAIAPSFQRIFLAPTESDDGILYAYELSELNLQGVELLTLGACETSLGRFDNSDNLVGLSLSLFLAGVHSIIGTLWPVEVGAAKNFFDTLYTRLNEGASKLEAFSAAQRRTRVVCPEFRDWGAFHYAGIW